MNALMLTSIRSGSTYLYNMLKDTGAFSFPAVYNSSPLLKDQYNYGEFFSPNHEHDPWDRLGVPKTRELCIQNLKMKANQPFKAPCLLKVLKEQYEYYMLTYDDRPLIESLFPAPKYIWLNRGDIYARTVSAYIFFVTKTPHLWNKGMKNKYDTQKVPFDAKGLLDVYYNHVKSGDWSAYLDGIDYLPVEYEDLVNKPEETLDRCLDYLGYAGKFDVKSIVEKQPKFKTERPESKEFIEKLKRMLVKML